MAIGGSLREIGRFLDECERGDRRVTSVELSESGGPEPSVAATVELSVDGAGPSGEVVPDLDSPSLGPDGRLRFAIASAPRLVPAVEYDVDVELVDATLERDGAISATLQVTTADGDAGSDPSRPRVVSGPADDEDPTGVAAAAEDEPDLPPFKDPDRLAEVYASCDTFAEMAETIDMDVTAETVRRYMIDYDIHEPNTYRTGDGDEPESASRETPEPLVISDGIGLPDDVTVDTLIDTVKRSNTIYEVTREVNVDREDALEMLEELNLLDLVVGRLATEGERDISRDEIVDRLREAPGTQ